MAKTKVKMETTLGPLTIELEDQLAPVTVANFLQYVDEKFFDGTIFHRVIPNFMIQGGGFEPGMKQKKTKGQIINESGNGLKNLKGTLAMARTSQPNSATAQFFVNAKDNDFLDKANAQDRVGYCVFGKVIDGLDIIAKIEKVPTGSKGGHGDVPLGDVKIVSVTRLPAE